MTLTFVPEPKLDKVVPDVVCDAQGDVIFALTGMSFVGIGATTPEVAITLNGMTVAMVAGTLVDMSCTTLPPAPTGPTEMVKLCTTMTILVPKGTLQASTY